MIKHTPGPWIVLTKTNKPTAVYREYDTTEGVICRMGAKRAALNADACLIAAAPDLYEAARKALEVVPVGPELDALVDALLKADGK